MTDMRRCIGSAKFGIEAHDAPPAEFPVQPSQRDGLGRLCRPHWREYTNALRKAALARQAAEAETAVARAQAAAVIHEARRTRAAKGRKAESDLIAEVVVHEASPVEAVVSA